MQILTKGESTVTLQGGGGEQQQLKWLKQVIQITWVSDLEWSEAIKWSEFTTARHSTFAASTIHSLKNFRKWLIMFHCSTFLAVLWMFDCFVKIFWLAAKLEHSFRAFSSLSRDDRFMLFPWVCYFLWFICHFLRTSQLWIERNGPQVARVTYMEGRHCKMVQYKALSLLNYQY